MTPTLVFVSSSALTGSRLRLEYYMSLNLFVDDSCPKCRKTIMQSFIEPHPTSSDLALHKLYCENCGPVETRVISLRLDLASAELAA